MNVADIAMYVACVPPASAAPSTATVGDWASPRTIIASPLPSPTAANTGPRSASCRSCDSASVPTSAPTPAPTVMAVNVVAPPPRSVASCGISESKAIVRPQCAPTSERISRTRRSRHA